MAPYSNHSTLLHTISLVCVFAVVTCTRSSPTHYEDCSALFQFKQSIIQQDGEGLCATSWFQTFHSWKPTRNTSDAGFDCCSWYGVECSSDEENGRVVGLDLSESFLCGHINSNNTLFSLVHLQKINLAMNKFDESQIPSEIARLQRLRSLNLSDSGFSGQIPKEISQLMHLTSLDLSFNKIPLKLQSPNLENLVQNLTSLEELHLSWVEINSSVPHFLANFSTLRSIRLSECLLQNNFPAGILELPELKFLDVASNDITGSFPKFRNSSLLEYIDLYETGFSGILPDSISNLNRLIYLSLSKCSFSGHIPGSLSNLMHLTYLALAYNNFTGIVPSLGSLSELNVLELSGNKFKNGRLPNWLGKLTQLTGLYAYDMNTTGEIPVFLANLTNLSVLSMQRNYLSGHIPSSFFNLTQLRNLELQSNQLHGPISSSFSNLKSLQRLRLDMNNFNGKVHLATFLGLNHLEELVLADNKISLVATTNYTNNTLPELTALDLTSCNLNEFPAFLQFKDNLRDLFLNNNKIKGLVPVWIWNNSQETLEVIELSHNLITGFHQHPRYFPWKSLQGFYIDNNQVRGRLPIPPQTTTYYSASHNSLTGDIPPLICKLKSLRFLDLSFNNMSGTLPSCFGSLSYSLVELSLRRNSFHGIMMNAFMHGSLLESIDLSENGFRGQLPRSLINCTNLEVLSLGDNSFHDVFPFWLGTHAKLQVLVLRSNKFYGQIQGSTTVCSQFPKLRIIDLSNNGFRGRLHQNYFETCNAMKSLYVGGEASVLGNEKNTVPFGSISRYTMTLIHKGVRTEFEEIFTICTAIHISCNNFEGPIPLSLQHLQRLESLNLSGNHFGGRVLPSLGYLKNLESLDLSRNELIGEIPQQLVQLTFLSIFNVSFNHLHGSIPQGQQFNTFDNDSYKENPGLCGKPLSKECQDPKVSRLPPASNTSESLLPSERIDWIFVFPGVVSGLVVGIVIGNFLYTRYSDRFIKRKDRWVRPLRNTRRNQGGV